MSDRDAWPGRNQADAETQLDSHSSASAELDATLGISAAFGISPLDGTSAQAPTFIGAYKLIGRLGEGGMGQVWLAEQTEPVHRTVALKLIRVGMYDDEVLQRFRAERQSLAMMDHPGIAKVFDAGATPDGQPYFVMEYVAGVPITQYCDEKKLTIRQRLELLIKVCEGVQHAHQKAIIHRDLKPANILVSEVDGKPVPRIIDFGLAKATGAQVGDEAMMTRVGGFVGTLGYMSPEQASGTGDVDTRTDVYSLGVVLYVLLTGNQPFDTTKWKSLPLYEVVRQQREVDPPRPSTKIRGDKASLKSTAEGRGVQVAQLEKLLHGDLDWITMKALEKDRARRYGTPMALAADVGRYLNHQAVEAAPPSFAYTASKFIRRNRLVLGGAAVIAVILVAATVISIWQSLRARREAAVAQAVSDFLQNDMLAQAGASSQARSGAQPDPDMKVRTALDHAAQRIAGKFSQQPEVEVAIRITMGNAYTDMGLYPKAHQQLESALELSRRVLGPDDPETLNALDRLGWLEYRQGEYTQAEALLNQAVQARRRILGPKHPDTLNSMSNLAVAFDDLGKYAQAESLDAQTLEARKRVLGPEHPGTLESMGHLAADYSRQSKYAQAEFLLAQALEIQKRVLGPEDPHTLWSLDYLANVYNKDGKYAQAGPLVAQALEIRKRVLGPEHPDTLDSMANLAGTYFSEGKYAQAESLDAQVLEIRKRVLGLEHPETLQSMDGLGLDYLQDLKDDQAEKILTQVRKTAERVVGPDSEIAASATYNLGCLAARQGQKDKAIVLLSQAVDHGLDTDGLLGIGQDTDLISLHGDARFTALVAHAKQVAQSRRAPAQAK